MPRKKVTPVEVSARDIETIAREQLGFENLRPEQLEAIQSLLAGRDTLVVQPTGSGKSAIYQLAGLILEGSTLIVSPLIALQKDQVDAIAGSDIESAATAMNSARPASEVSQDFDQIEQGKVEFIFMAPEQLRKREVIEALGRAQISLVVIDEAHCISQWGHDFRPDYLQLGAVIQALGSPRVLGLTATATPAVRDEIVERLQMRRPTILVRNLDRPNIHLRTDHFESEEEKRDGLIHRVRWAEGPGIIYVGTRRNAEEIRHALDKEGIPSLFYHGGLNGKDRERVQEKFMEDEARVMVATNAFGMGIDKPNIRFVYHFDPPESLDSYSQEIGRAGRDGERADAVLFYRQADIGAQSFKAAEARSKPALLEQIAEIISAEEDAVNLETLAEETGLTERRVTAAVQQLENVDAAEWAAGGAVRSGEEMDPQEAASLAAEYQERRRAAARDRLEQMRAYANCKSCRREFLLRYLGEDFTGPCGFCDNCEAAARGTQVDPAIGTRREV